MQGAELSAAHAHHWAKAWERVGPPTLRLVAGLFIPASVILVALAAPAYFNPRGAGDAWTYLAAGERLNAGHALYALSPGDRPVPLSPPYWTVPLVSPPPIAVLWRPLALVGDGAALVWWVAGIVSIALLALWLVWRGSPWTHVGFILLSPALVLTALSGNAAAFLVPALVLAWRWRDDRPVAAGAIVAVAVAVKVAPVVLVLWLLVTRRWRALGGFVAAGLVLFALSVVGAGWSTTWQTLSVLRGVGAAPMSLEHLTGVPSWAWFAVGAAAVALLPVRDGWRFALAVATAALSTPAAYFGSLVLLAAALAPTVRGFPVGRSSPEPRTHANQVTPLK